MTTSTNLMTSPDKITYPVIYYYPGVPGTFSHFGHIAIALDEKTYITYGEHFRNIISEDLGVKRDKATYECDPIVISLPKPKNNYAELDSNWRTDFPDGKYNFLTNNCAHSVSYCLDKLGFGHSLSFIDNTRPATIAERACNIQLASLAEERKNILAQHFNPKKTVELLIANEIARLKIEIALEKIKNPESKKSQKKSPHTLFFKGSRDKISIREQQLAALEFLNEQIQIQEPEIFQKHLATFANSGNKTLKECSALYKDYDPNNEQHQDIEKQYKLIKFNDTHSDLTEKLNNFLMQNKNDISDIFSSLHNASRFCGENATSIQELKKQYDDFYKMVTVLIDTLGALQKISAKKINEINIVEELTTKINQMLQAKTSPAMLQRMKHHLLIKLFTSVVAAVAAISGNGLFSCGFCSP